MTEEQLRKAWEDCNKKFQAPEEYIDGMNRIQQDDKVFIVLLFDTRKAKGECYDVLGSCGSLSVYSRRRIRTPYHVYLTGSDVPQPPQPEELGQWHWAITPQGLKDALEFASSTDFFLTFSTIKSGTSEALNMHFQGIPRIVKWNGEEYKPFDTLLKSSESLVESVGGTTVSVLDYFTTVLRIVGKKQDVCKVVLPLCLGYDALRSFNLIASSVAGDKERVMVYFFPRRLDGYNMPSRYAHDNWTFGSFEMGGFFLVGNQKTYGNVSFQDLADSLSEVGIQKGSLEYTLVRNILYKDIVLGL